MRPTPNLILFLAATAFLPQSIAAPASLPAGLRTFFAFEAEAWSQLTGAELIRHELARHPGNPVIARGDKDAVDAHRITYASILPEGNRLRAWYGAMQSNGASSMHIAYAESEDGIHWTKPTFDHVRAGTNLVIKGAHYMTVSPDLGGEYKYRAMVAFLAPRIRGGGTGSSFGTATSNDGIRWNYDGKPGTNLGHFEAYGLFRRNDRWWVLGQGVAPDIHPVHGGLPHRVMYGLHSSDGKAFELHPKPLFFYPGNARFPDAGLQHHVGAAVWDRSRVLVGFAGQLWPASFSSKVHFAIGLLYSYDGLNWSEPFARTPILAPGDSGAWDDGYLLQIQNPVSRGAQTYFFYGGGDGGNEWSTKSSLGLATLRRDGFASLKAVSDGAVLVSKVLERQSDETHLYLNSKGKIQVQILDENLKPVSPQLAVVKDSVRGAVVDLTTLAVPGRFCVSFSLARNAEVFTFSLGPPPDRLPSLNQWEQ